NYDIDLSKTLVRTFQSVFPQTAIVLVESTTVLIGLRDGPAVTMRDLRKRYADPRVHEDLAAIGVESPEALLAWIVVGPEKVRSWSGPGPLNTDDHPLIEYLGPRAE